jgi:uncharacterized protein
VTAALALSATVAPGRAAADYPPRRSEVNDFAAVLGPGDEAAIRDRLADLRAGAGIEAVVVTVGSIREYRTGDASIESFATHLFNAWGIGDRRRNDGILVLVAVADRAVRIEVGSGYGRGLDAKMKAIIDRVMVPRFKRDDLGGAVRAGVEAIHAALAGTRAPEAAASPTAAPRPAEPRQVEAGLRSPPQLERPPEPETGRRSRPRAVSTSTPEGGAHVTDLVLRAIAGNPDLLVYGVLGLLVAASLAAAGVSLFRRRRHRCPDCRAKMTRLDEVADDEFLDPGQELEETLGSVNHEVWRCDGCGRHRLVSRPRWSSSYRTCPKCRLRAVEEHGETVLQPTYSSTGEHRISRRCRSCDFREEKIVTLPKLVATAAAPPPAERVSSPSQSYRPIHGSSHSSGGWSFGGGSSGRGSRGGRSSGRGASGTW